MTSFGSCPPHPTPPQPHSTPPPPHPGTLTCLAVSHAGRCVNSDGLHSDVTLSIPPPPPPTPTPPPSAAPIHPLAAASACCLLDPSTRFPAIQAASCSRPPAAAAGRPPATAGSQAPRAVAALLRRSASHCCCSSCCRSCCNSISKLLTRCIRCVANCAAVRPAAALAALAFDRVAAALVPSRASMAVASSARNAAS